jgi:nucleoside-diphosphate-sugar epimerase
MLDIASNHIHVVFGAGQVGPPLAARLLEKGKRVRVVTRSGTAVPGAEVLAGDATDPAVCRGAAEGATALYHCMNPAYDADAWERVLPVLMDNLIAAAGASGARLVVLENLYPYGTPEGPIDERTPFNPCSRKGEIRAAVSGRLADAQARGGVRAAVGRASDFFGPGGVGTHFADRFWKPALAGKPARFVFDPDATHSYSYIPDVAAGLATLGCAPDDVLGQVWMLPVADVRSARELTGHFSQALGREIRVGGTPRLFVKLFGLFVPIVREVEEMLHEWEAPFVVDDRKFRERFGAEPTPIDEAAQATVAWARAEYSTP